MILLSYRNPAYWFPIKVLSPLYWTVCFQVSTWQVPSWLYIQHIQFTLIINLASICLTTCHGSSHLHIHAVGHKLAFTHSPLSHRQPLSPCTFICSQSHKNNLAMISTIFGLHVTKQVNGPMFFWKWKSKFFWLESAGISTMQIHLHDNIIKRAFTGHLWTIQYPES